MILAVKYEVGERLSEATDEPISQTQEVLVGDKGLRYKCHRGENASVKVLAALGPCFAQFWYFTPLEIRLTSMAATGWNKRIASSSLATFLSLDAGQRDCRSSADERSLKLS